VFNEPLLRNGSGIFAYHAAVAQQRFYTAQYRESNDEKKRHMQQVAGTLTEQLQNAK
jgi:hypothetical protein